MLLKVVIIEDNPITVRSLVETIKWETLGCEVAGTALDGEAGCQLILSTRPDIILTDIRMPKCDGLEMIETVRQSVPDCKVIIITGYDQFQYASRAIKLAIFDYLLKPIDSEELINCVRRAVDATLSRQAIDVTQQQVDTLRRRAQLSLLLTNPSQHGQGVRAMFVEMGLSFQSYYIMTVQSSDERTFTQAELNHIDGVITAMEVSAVTILLYDTVVAFVMLDSAGDGWQSGAETLVRAVVQSMAVPVCIGVSELSTSLHAVRQTYHQARQAMWQAALETRPSAAVFYAGPEPSGRPSEGITNMNHRIEELIDRADLSDEAAARTAHELVALSGHQYSHLRAMTAMYTLALMNRCAVSSGVETDAALYGTWFVTNEADVRECLTKLHGALRSAREQTQLSLLTRNAIQYINLHAVEGVQLGTVAEKLSVSGNYLSALIRKETGITFHEHVLNAKMAVARNLLADPRMLVEEVARAVGYGNYISFYNAFKRSEHMTPTEYRNRRVTL